ncbi:cysteinyl-tRNA synthetase [Acanthamoeba polyphaga mimivirus]|uniref:Cysteinyl-tRNA synthetase n=1 Tax=Acanthamoeba polyphaga mimivirus TaxID=212035 RepID=A0A0G2Y344_MIMIV|nr:cysteinyl-tRNA synthetase [Acanthamoeba polyphaga mimivirus]
METELSETILPTITKMYVCGPTVYNDAHIGHARIYVIVDLINRTMNKILNKPTHLVMNVTDIDDKIIRESKNKGITWLELARLHENSFFDCMSKLNVTRPDSVIRVTESISDIVLYIQQIINNGFAYIVSDGSVYFDSIEYKKAGYEFSEIDDEEEQQYESFLSKEIISQKKHHKDFALWKGRSESDVGFNVEFIFDNQTLKSFGVPGWHIECSAMIKKTLGNSIDIHFGGIDLKFPHHYNECLQANAYHHPMYNPLHQSDTMIFHKWTREFIHVGHLCIKGQKMSKSLKNFSTIKEMLDKINSNQFRWLFMSTKWKQQVDFTDGLISIAKELDSTVVNFVNRVSNYPFEVSDVEFNDKETLLHDDFYRIQQRIYSYLTEFKFEMVARSVQHLIGTTNVYLDLPRPNESIVGKIRDYLLDLLDKLGFIYRVGNSSSSHKIKDLMNILIETRSQLRQLTRNPDLSPGIKKQLFDILDRQRNIQLPDIGIILEDSKDSSLWYENSCVQSSE